MAEVFKIEGLRELEAALRELPKATGKNVLRRVLKKIAKPIVDDARSKAPVDTGLLVSRIDQSGSLSANERNEGGGGPQFLGIGDDGKKIFSKADAKNFVEVHVGVAGRKQSLARGIFQEFGTVDHSAHPFMRPAWDGNKESGLSTFKADLWKEIEKAAARRARKLAKG
jgi:HK97 gp10 family phage protein